MDAKDVFALFVTSVAFIVGLWLGSINSDQFRVVVTCYAGILALVCLGVLINKALSADKTR